MTSASWALQQAVFAALAASPAVHAQAGDRIFDAVPRGAAFPYIVLGEGSETANGDSAEHTLSIHLWSRGGGHREIKRLSALVQEALATLTLDGHHLIDWRFASADYARQSDGETYRAVLRFKALTETN